MGRKKKKRTSTSSIRSVGDFLKIAVLFILLMVLGISIFIGWFAMQVHFRKEYLHSLTENSYMVVKGQMDVNETEYGRRDRRLRTRLIGIEGFETPFRTLEPSTYYDDTTYNKIQAIPLFAHVEVKVLKDDFHKRGMYFNWLIGRLFYRKNAIQILELKQGDKIIYSRDFESIYLGNGEMMGQFPIPLIICGLIFMIIINTLQKYGVIPPRPQTQ